MAPEGSRPELRRVLATVFLDAVGFGLVCKACRDRPAEAGDQAVAWPHGLATAAGVETA